MNIGEDPPIVKQNLAAVADKSPRSSLTFWCRANRCERYLDFHDIFFGSNARPEIAYQACVGIDQKRCPKSLLFVKGDLDTISERVERECEGYSRQSILLKEAPSQDCDCILVEIKCLSPEQ